MTNELAQLTADQKKRVKNLINDRRTFAKKYVKIRTKNGDLINFIFNQAQNKALALFEHGLSDTTKPARFIVLKARQEGISTMIEYLIFMLAAYKKNKAALIIAHEKEASNNLFEMNKRFYRNLPVFLQPSQSLSNAKELVFDRMNSNIRIATAESRENTGRSANYQYLHCSEVAFWSDAESTMLALSQTVADVPDTAIFIESTANGIGGYFYDTWQAAVAGENNYTPIFLAWFDLPDYSHPFDTPELKTLFQNSLTDYERGLIANYNLTLEQLHWRRNTIKDKCNNDELQFRQEYPATPEEAFIASGRPVFDTALCSVNLAAAQQNQNIQGDLIYTNDGRTTVEFVPNSKGYISLHKEIKAEDKSSIFGRYVAGCDVAEGLAQGDRSIIKVLDRTDMSIALSWAGHIDPDLLADEQRKITLYLNSDIVFCTEMNNHGLTTITKAHDYSLNQYYRQVFGKGYPTSATGFGWRTTAESKKRLVDTLNQYIREKSFTDYDPEFWRECLTFVRNEKGQMQAQDKDKNPGTKCYDDRVIAVGLALQCHIWMPSVRIEPEPEPVRANFEMTTRGSRATRF